MIYDRIIPAPGGDFDIIKAASKARSFPNYNLTITGTPVSIACNLLAAAAGNPSMRLLAANGYPNASNNYISPANDSTANQAGAYVAPPPAVPLTIAFHSSYSICISSPASANLCLPNRTYDQSTGLMGYTITRANAVTPAPPLPCPLPTQAAR